jgi:hypothetical protein
VVQAFGGEQAADATATSRICERVGNLPLALRLVGRYLAEQEEEASEYLTWLEKLLSPRSIKVPRGRRVCPCS